MLNRDELIERVLSRIDGPQFTALQSRFKRHEFAKYFDARRWVTINVARAELLGLLDDERPHTVLDLGAGFGYFLLVCRELGHRAVGIDLPEPLYQAATKLLGVRVHEHEIRPWCVLPTALERPFSLVTAHMVCFNGHNTPQLWGVDDWSRFLNRFVGSTLHLELNRERADGTLFPRGVAELFGDRGAMITGHHVVFPRVRPPRER